jgi:transmembrane 9 superfamily member 2/4
MRLFPSNHPVLPSSFVFSGAVSSPSAPLTPSSPLPPFPPAPPFPSQGDVTQIKVNKLTSTKTQLPYEYYSLPYCSPSKVHKYAENLGEVLRGDRIENSMYEIRMRYDEFCKVVCRKELSAKEAAKFRARVKGDYRVFM